MPGFIHTLQIERAYGVDTGAPGIDVDDYNQPVREFSTLDTVPGLIQPKTVREQALISQAGAAVADHTIFLARQDLTEADRIRSDGTLYEILGVRDLNFGGLAHLEVDARKITSQTLEVEGS